MHTPLRHVRALFSKKRPIHLTYFVTRRCNARCPLCFYARARDAEHAPPELSLEEIRRVAGSLDPLLWVLFSGGEPFLREDLVEISRIFHDTSRAVFLTYPTNGLQPEVIAARTEEILARCPDSVVVLKLSLDGVGERHDAVRGIPGGFAKLLRTHERLAALARRYPNLELGFNTLFCAANQWHMDEIIEFVHGLEEVRAHTLTMIRDHPGGEARGSVDLDQYARATARLEERWRSGPARYHRFAGSRLKAAQDRLQRRLLRQTLIQRRRSTPCYAGRLDLVLSESGELHPCEARWDWSFGNVRETGGDVPALLRTDRARRIREEIARGECFCSNECNLLTSILFSPRLHPQLARDYARLRLRRPGRRDAPASPWRGPPGEVGPAGLAPPAAAG